MTPALAALLKECEEREPRLVAIVRAMDEDRERLLRRCSVGSLVVHSIDTDARIDALARGEEG